MSANEPLRAVLMIGVCAAALACARCSDRSGGPLPGAAPVAEEKDFKGKPDQPAASPPPPAATPMTAEQIFSTRCAACHGPNGHGDGPASVALNPKPRNYTDAAWQKSVTDDQIKKTIVEGGAAVGKSPTMVPNSDLKDQPEVVEGLVKIVRGFGKPQGT